MISIRIDVYPEATMAGKDYLQGIASRFKARQHSVDAARVIEVDRRDQMEVQAPRIFEQLRAAIRRDTDEINRKSIAT